MNLKDIMASERSQSPKNTLCDPLLQRPEQASPQRRISGCPGLGEGVTEVRAKECGPAGANKHILKLMAVIHAQLCKYTKKH